MSEKEIGKLIEFSEWAKNELTEIKKDVKDLQYFKWRVTSGAVAISFVVSLVGQLILALSK